MFMFKIYTYTYICYIYVIYFLLTYGVFVNCSGIFIKTLANASHDRRSLSAPQIVLNAIGFSITVIVTVLITLYAKRRIKELQMQEELPLLQ